MSERFVKVNEYWVFDKKTKKYLNLDDVCDLLNEKEKSENAI